MRKYLFFILYSLFIAMPAALHAAPAPNPRGSANTVTRTDSETVSRSAVSRSATVRTANPSVHGAVSNRAATRGVVNARIATVKPTTSARSATKTVRAASSVSPATLTRAGSSRATAIFEDVSKMGTGYANCREAYNTCMDQFCAKSNDTYRRCYCSPKITEFRNTEAALDEAKSLLMRFEDNNLNAVDKTAAEVSAMYSATVGEQAIKNDPSAAQQVLSEIGDLLSGKKKPNTSGSSSVASLSAASLDFTVDMEDIWSGGGGSSSSIFGSGMDTDLTAKEGQDLYLAASQQCAEIIGSACETAAVATMAKSSYSILITQDCNAYEKKIETQRQSVLEVARTAEKYLRDARLEEYRSHNSADVNECITKVKTAVTAGMACGENYNRCLDYSGQYINPSTGEAVYTAHLQDLPKMIQLDGTADVLSGNPQFVQFLDSKKMFAETALDTCRDKAAVVWEEFKRSALIEIAQAQDEKIEEVKSTCVTTMKECYDAQSGALASFDNTTAQASGALQAYASRAMCQDKVAACAAVYATPTSPPCEFDRATGKVTNGHNCGLAALQSFVGAVDNVKVAEGCEVGLAGFVESTCAPASADTKHSSPYGCRLQSKSEIQTMLRNFAINNCSDPTQEKITEWTAFAAAYPTIQPMIDTTVRKILENIDYVLYEECDNADGIWVGVNSNGAYAAGDVVGTDKPEQAFYAAAFAGRAPTISASMTTTDARAGTSWGVCLQNSVMYQCKAQDEATGGKGYATFNAANNTCTFQPEWYQIKCESLGGYYENGVCYN